MIDKLRGVLALACAALTFMSSGAAAQTQPASTDSGFVGIPDYRSEETGVPFFWKFNAESLDKSIRGMRAAIAKCDRQAYNLAARRLLSYDPVPGLDDKTFKARSDRDRASMTRAHEELAPKYPQPCPPPPAAQAAAPPPPLFAGLPEYQSQETGIPFYWKEIADQLDAYIQAKRAAIANCDREAYRKVVVPVIRFPAVANVSNEMHNARADRDNANFKRAIAEQTPAFPEPCNRQVGMALPSAPSGGGTQFSVWVTGGATVPFRFSSSVTGVDTFFGPGNYLIDSKPGLGGGSITPTVGGRVRFSLDPIDWFSPPAERPGGANALRLFLESGVQTGFGAQSFIQPFQRVSGFPQGFGSNTINENFQIPIVAGLQFPFTLGSPQNPPATVDLYGGITIDSWTQTLQGNEAGGPANAQGFFGQNNRYTVDPTIGLGVTIPIGDTGFRVGFNTELMFRPGSVVTARSYTFPSETYYGSVDPSLMASFMIRLGWQIDAIGRRR
jgi:hypothetical protein